MKIEKGHKMGKMSEEGSRTMGHEWRRTTEGERGLAEGSGGTWDEKQQEQSIHGNVIIKPLLCMLFFFFFKFGFSKH